MGSIITTIKNIFTFILFIFIILLTYIQSLFMYGGYKPTGEFYLKTSSSLGDAGVNDVVDIEMEKKTYNLGESIEAKIGFGTKESSANYDGYENCATELVISFYEDKKQYNGPYDVLTFTYQNTFCSENYSVYEEKSYLDFLGHYWYWYPDFYPNFHQDVEFTIPKGVEDGVIVISVFTIIDDNKYLVSGLEIHYEVKDDKVYFEKNNLHLY